MNSELSVQRGREKPQRLQRLLMSRLSSSIQEEKEREKKTHEVVEQEPPSRKVITSYHSPSNSRDTCFTRERAVQSHTKKPMEINCDDFRPQIPKQPRDKHQNRTLLQLQISKSWTVCNEVHLSIFWSLHRHTQTSLSLVTPSPQEELEEVNCHCVPQRSPGGMFLGGICLSQGKVALTEEPDQV